MSKRAYHDGAKEAISRFLKWSVDQPGSAADMVQEFRTLEKDRDEITKTVHELLFPETLKLVMGPMPRRNNAREV